jgi:hypothetical protein
MDRKGREGGGQGAEKLIGGVLFDCMHACMHACMYVCMHCVLVGHGF